MVTLNYSNKNSASLTFRAKHSDVVLGDVQNLTFNDQLFDDGTLVKDATFNQLQNATLNYPNSNQATLNFPTKS